MFYLHRLGVGSSLKTQELVVPCSRMLSVTVHMIHNPSTPYFEGTQTHQAIGVT